MTYLTSSPSLSLIKEKSRPKAALIAHYWASLLRRGELKVLILALAASCSI